MKRVQPRYDEDSERWNHLEIKGKGEKMKIKNEERDTRVKKKEAPHRKLKARRLEGFLLQSCPVYVFPQRLVPLAPSRCSG